MTGVAIELDATEVEALVARLERAGAADPSRLAAALAGVGESATRARIAAGGPAPEGKAWPRREGSAHPHPLLNRGGGLLQSITGESRGDVAAWGSNLVYARIHQLGGTIVPVSAAVLAFPSPFEGASNADKSGGDGDGEAMQFASSVTIPPRPYLGWGADEQRGAADVVEAWLDRALGRGVQ